MGDDRPSTYIEDTPNGPRVIYRASSVGNCIRGLVASRLGYTPTAHPDWLLNKFAQGVRQEPIILEQLKHRGWKMLPDEGMLQYGPRVVGGQLETEIPVGENTIIRCHPDGIAECYALSVGDQWALRSHRVVEAKAFAPNMVELYESKGISHFPYYSMQLSIEMASTGLPGLFILGLKDKDNPDNDCGEFKFYFYDTPPVNIGIIKAKVALAEAWVARGELPPCDWAQYPCQFYYLHEEDDTKLVKVVSNPERRALFDGYAEMYDKAKAAEAEAKRKKEEAKAFLLEELDNNKVVARGLLGGDEWVVQDVSYDREQLSEKKLKEFGHDPKRYMTKVLVRYPKVSRKK